MSADKKEIMADLKFCRELMNRLYTYAHKHNSSGYDGHGTVVKNDIIRLRRELNEVSHKLEWTYRKEQI